MSNDTVSKTRGQLFSKKYYIDIVAHFCYHIDLSKSLPSVGKIDGGEFCLDRLGEIDFIYIVKGLISNYQFYLRCRQSNLFG